jgi:hypothetical protein
MEATKVRRVPLKAAGMPLKAADMPLKAAHEPLSIGCDGAFFAMRGA